VPSMEPKPEAVFVLRRLKAEQWEETEVLPGAFALRRNESGLSVFAEDKQTPHTLLQALLNSQHKKYRKNPEKLNEWLQDNGATVEELVNNGWRVARVPLSAFPSDVFTFTTPKPDGDGHHEIIGTADDFDTYSVEIADKAILCTSEECLE
jgi:hypothetical protein